MSELIEAKPTEALIEETKHYLNNLAPNDDSYLRILIERMVKRWETTHVKGNTGRKRRQ